MANAPVATTELYEHAMLNIRGKWTGINTLGCCPSGGRLRAKVRSSVRILLDLYVHFLCLDIRSHIEDT